MEFFRENFPKNEADVDEVFRLGGFCFGIFFRQ